MSRRNLYRINHPNIKKIFEGYEQPNHRFADEYVKNLIKQGILIPVESTKLERKLRDTLNRITKLIPSVRRISELDRIAVELEAEADAYGSLGVGVSPSIGGVDPDSLRTDALYLRRLEYDLTSMREAKATLQPKQQSTMRASSRYEPSQWKRGPRP